MSDERDVAAMARDDYNERLRLRKAQMPPKAKPKPPFSAPAETHKESEKVTTVTIEFERMPGVDEPVKLSFQRIVRETYCTYECGTVIFREWAICHPSDTFSWEVGMRLAAKRACSPEAYRAFRRWMWLAKAAHECEKLGTSCAGCPYFGETRPPCTWGNDSVLLPDYHIAREFGRVKVMVT